jgi:hypothetical protein
MAGSSLAVGGGAVLTGAVGCVGRGVEIVAGGGVVAAGAASGASFSVPEAPSSDPTLIFFLSLPNR